MFRQLILLVLIIAFALAHKFELSEEDKKINEECTKELGYELTKLEKGQKPSEEDKKKFNCMMKCTYIKKGVISEDGALNAEKNKEKYNADAEKVNAAIEMCKDKSGDDDCLKIINKVWCVLKEIFPKRLVMINN